MFQRVQSLLYGMLMHQMPHQASPLSEHFVLFERVVQDEATFDFLFDDTFIRPFIAEGFHDDAGATNGGRRYNVAVRLSRPEDSQRVLITIFIVFDTMQNFWLNANY